jgi:hypothetical protein
LSLAGRAQPSDADLFPYKIPVALGANEFAPGDNIVIASLRGDRPHLEIGGRYLLEGTYTLASLDSANLSWSITTRGPSGPTPTQASANAAVRSGKGEFRLSKTFENDGWPHVSFYSGHSQGGVYFGESGAEKTVLRQKAWSDFTDPQAATNRGSNMLSVSGNAAIIAYLGDPVPLPLNLETRYAAAGMKAEFTKLVEVAGRKVQKLAVDASEFPCLVYGTVAGADNLQRVQEALGATPGYAYGGSVVGRMGNDTTYFAFNLTPEDRYHRAQVEAVHRRLMIRLQMLAEKARTSELMQK